MNQSATTHRFAAALKERPRLRRELLIAAIALPAGLIVMPLLIYLAGTLSLGPYAAGGLGSFIKDFYLGLLRGWVPAWCVALGPYLLFSLLRGARLAYRRYVRPPAADPAADD